MLSFNIDRSFMMNPDGDHTKLPQVISESINPDGSRMINPSCISINIDGSRMINPNGSEVNYPIILDALI